MAAWSAIWLRRWGRFVLTDPQRQTLLDLARRAVVARVRRAELAVAAAGDLPRAAGVFVTLKLGGTLRGCLGTLECRDDLAAEVARYAGNAAAEDPRFPPVTPADVAALSIDISVLGPLERLDPVDPEVIVIGRHGLVAELGMRRGVLLPQVAEEYSWTAEQFLRHTCVKAGITPDGWRRGALIYTFAAEVFGE